MPNSAIPTKDKLYASIRDRHIRVFQVDPAKHLIPNIMPWDPDITDDGFWMNANDTEKLDDVSALALKFVAELYPVLNAQRDVPVGFLNLTHGGTPITGWMPLEDIDHNPALATRLRELDIYPTQDTWNTKGDLNFQQTSAQYNMRIAPATGAKVRGILWYQGENECAGEFTNHVYADYLRAYHEMYRTRFAAFPDNFLMLSSLIYPWTYGKSGECNVGYLNEAFIETAAESPDKFAYMPICDLNPMWIHHQNNHPIHPGRKYEQAERMAKLALSHQYGIPGQTAPARLERFEIVGSRLRLHFCNVGSGLYIKGLKPRCLYVAGSDGCYLPADCAVVSPDTLEVWCDEIKSPIHAAFAIQSLEPMCNLYAGDYPLSPFYTDRVNCLSIEARPWYDTGVNAVWGLVEHADATLDLFYRPVWQALAGSTIRHDAAFTPENIPRLRAAGEGSDFGCSVRAWPYNRLDFQKYAGMSVDLYNADSTQASLVLETDDSAVTIPFTDAQTLPGAWVRRIARFENLPDAEIRRMKFCFSKPEGILKFVNIHRVRLLPR